MLQSFKQTLFEGVCQSTILSKFVKLVFGLLFGHSYQQVRMVSKMYTFQDVHTGSHVGQKTSKASCYIMPPCPCCTITSNLYHIMVGLVYFPPSQGLLQRPIQHIPAASQRPRGWTHNSLKLWPQRFRGGSPDRVTVVRSKGFESSGKEQ